MFRHYPRIKPFCCLLLLFLLAACASKEPEVTATPTEQPKQTAEIVIIPSEALVDQILIQKPAEGDDNIAVRVQGHTSNTCVSVQDVEVSQAGDVFSIGLVTSTIPGSDCIEKQVDFEKTISLSAQDLQAGTYFVTSGVVESFDYEVPQTTEAASAAAEEQATPTVEPTPTEEPVLIEPRDCEDLASFVADVTIPDNSPVDPGDRIVKTWEIRNEGTCTWGPGYELVFSDGAFSQVVSLSDPFPEVEPDAVVELSTELSAPDSPGSYSGTWKIKRLEGDNVEVQAGSDFDLWATIIVTGEDSSISEGGLVCSESNSVFESQLLQLINTARANNGRPAYELNPLLTNVARNLSNDMSCNDFVSHTGSDGSSWYDRITAAGYAYSDAAENIYFGYGSVPQLAYNWWMNSEVHRNNILSSKMTQIGIAYALNPQTGASYYTLVFAAP